MEVFVEYLGGVKFRTAARGHGILCDQPKDNGGDDAGMSPPEFLLASLGTCAGYYAAQYLRARSLPVHGLSVHVSAEKGTQPARLSSFRIEVIAPVTDERHREGVLRAVRSCLIHNTLVHAPAIDVEVRGEAAVEEESHARIG